MMTTRTGHQLTHTPYAQTQPPNKYNTTKAQLDIQVKTSRHLDSHRTIPAQNSTMQKPKTYTHKSSDPAAIPRDLAAIRQDPTDKPRDPNSDPSRPRAAHTTKQLTARIARYNSGTDYQSPKPMPIATFHLSRDDLLESYHFIDQYAYLRLQPPNQHLHRLKPPAVFNICAITMLFTAISTHKIQIHLDNPTVADRTCTVDQKGVFVPDPKNTRNRTKRTPAPQTSPE